MHLKITFYRRIIIFYVIFYIIFYSYSLYFYCHFPVIYMQ